MSGTYDPQIVGSHFVKQYYTQLHKEPAQLHRFYLDQSSYVHGGSDIGSEQPVVGQKAIHEKILSINFKSVHAKIKQVDSHATLGDGIVIQVTGELSVNGQPMRAFVQTFVLAPESPKKYYVHNDIFRYQDDIYDATSESENNEGLADREQEGIVPVQPMEVYQTEEPPEVVDVSLQNGGRPQPPIVEQPLVEGKEAWVQYNDIGGHTAESVSSDTSTPLDPSQPSKSPELNYKDADAGMQVDNSEVINMADEDNPEYMASGEEEKPNLSWASRISKSKPQTAILSMGSQQPLPLPQVQQATALQQPPTDVRKKPTENSTLGGAGGRGFGSQEVPRRSFASRNVPDTYQLFVGGLPNSTSEQELTAIFTPYGRILEIRNNANNFAFLVFDSEKPVKAILGRKDPFKIRGKTLNIEKKKPTSETRGGMVGKFYRRDNGPPPQGQKFRSGPKNVKR